MDYDEKKLIQKCEKLIERMRGFVYMNEVPRRWVGGWLITNKTGDYMFDVNENMNAKETNKPMSRQEWRAAKSQLRKQKKKTGWIQMYRIANPEPKEETIAEQMEVANQSYEEALLGLMSGETWQNDIYVAAVRHFDIPNTPTAHLMIYRKDSLPRHDWRHFQRIKNDIIGEECEAFELYPAESRLVDTRNTYHLWAFPAGHIIPVPVILGNGRDVRNGGLDQRPLDEPDSELKRKDAYAKKHGIKPTGPTIISITWYNDREHFRKAQELMDLPGTYEEFSRDMKEFEKTANRKGIQIVKMPINLDEFADLCREHGQDMNGETRLKYTQWKANADTPHPFLKT